MSTVIIIPSGAAVAAGILRPLYRRALGAQYGPFGVYTTDGVATGTEARRQIVCSSLIDDFEDASRLKRRYLYVATGTYAGTQTRIRDAGYHGSIGYLEVTKPLAAPLASGIEIEIGTWPCDRYLDQKGLNQLVNEALARCLIEYRAVLTGAGTTGISLLDAEGYIDQSGRVDAVYDNLDTVGTTDPLEPSPYGSRVDASGAERTLVTDIAYASSDSVELRVLRAGHTLINDGSGWVTSAVGLTSDDQAAAAPVPWVVAFGMVKLLQIQTEMVEQDETLSDTVKARRLTLLAGRRRQWSRAAATIMLDQFPKPTPQLSRGLSTFDTTVVGWS